MAINPFWMNAFGQNVANAGSGPVPRGVMAAEPTTGNGLFGANPEQRDMLLTLGMNLLAGSGYSPQKRTTGEILGSAMLAAQQSQAATRDRMMKQRLQEAQLAQMEREASQPVAVGQGTTLIDPNTREVVYQGETQQPASVKEFEYAKQNGYKGTFQEWSTISAQSELPSSVREWKFFSGLPKDQQNQYLQMKRSSQVETIAGVPTQITGGNVEPLSTLEQEAGAASTLAGAAAAGKESGTTAAKAKLDFPRLEQNTREAIGVLDQLTQHPGLPYITGVYSKAPIVPGTSQAAADALAQQVQGQTFLRAYETLKGGGQITEVEGKKAEAAIARLSRAQNTTDYQAALKELKGVMSTGLERARKSAGQRGSQPQYTEGQTATNPKTGEKLIFRGGRWQKP